MLPSLSTMHSPWISQGLGWPFGQSLEPWQPLIWSPVKPVLQSPQRKEPCRTQKRVKSPDPSLKKCRAVHEAVPVILLQCCSSGSWPCSLHSEVDQGTHRHPHTPGRNNENHFRRKILLWYVYPLLLKTKCSTDKSFI